MSLCATAGLWAVVVDPVSTDHGSAPPIDQLGAGRGCAKQSASDIGAKLSFKSITFILALLLYRNGQKAFIFGFLSLDPRVGSAPDPYYRLVR